MSFKINHLAIVVPDLKEALHFWQDALGLELDHMESNRDEQVEIAFMKAGESHLELLEPTEETSGIGKYLAKRGPGLHHVCLEVDNIEAAMQDLRDKNIELINDSPKTRPSDGIRYCFVHPKSTHGVLVELYELP